MRRRLKINPVIRKSVEKRESKEKKRKKRRTWTDLQKVSRRRRRFLTQHQRNLGEKRLVKPKSESKTCFSTIVSRKRQCMQCMRGWHAFCTCFPRPSQGYSSLIIIVCCSSSGKFNCDRNLICHPIREQQAARHSLTGWSFTCTLSSPGFLSFFSISPLIPLSLLLSAPA